MAWPALALGRVAIARGDAAKGRPTRPTGARLGHRIAAADMTGARRSRGVGDLAHRVAGDRTHRTIDRDRAGRPGSSEAGRHHPAIVAARRRADRPRHPAFHRGHQRGQRAGHPPRGTEHRPDRDRPCRRPDRVRGLRRTPGGSRDGLPPTGPTSNHSGRHPIGRVATAIVRPTDPRGATDRVDPHDRGDPRDPAGPHDPAGLHDRDRGARHTRRRRSGLHRRPIPTSSVRAKSWSRAVAPSRRRSSRSDRRSD